MLNLTKKMQIPLCVGCPRPLCATHLLMVSRYGQWRLLRSSESMRPFFAERKIIKSSENGKPILRVNYQYQQTQKREKQIRTSSVTNSLKTPQNAHFNGK